MRSVWAVTRNTIAQVLRMKVAVMIFFLLIILLPVMSVIMVGDSTLTGKLQSFVSYGLSLTTLMLSMLTIVISAYTLSNDIERKHIFLVITKPVTRMKYLLGKLIGIVIVDAVLLLMFAAIIYGLAIYMTNSTEDQHQVAQAREKFFTARAVMTDTIDKKALKVKAMKIYQDRLEKRQVPEGMTLRQVASQIFSEEMGKIKNVEAGTSRKWEFENVHLKENAKLYLKFKLDTLSGYDGDKIYGTWIIGDIRQDLTNISERKTPVYRDDRADVVRIIHEIEIPADAIAEDGYLALEYKNPFESGITVSHTDLEILYDSGSFAMNYCKISLLILARLIFLACLGLSVATWLSFPVAILFCLLVLVSSVVKFFFFESFMTLGIGLSEVYNFTVKPMLWLLPEFGGKFSPTAYMVSGETLGISLLCKAYLNIVIIRASIVAMLGVWIFSRRELAKIST